MAKKWTSCISCDYQNECLVCQSRLEGCDKTLPSVQDIGCFNLEMIKKQREKQLENQQLKLFKM